MRRLLFVPHVDKAKKRLQKHLCTCQKKDSQLSIKASILDGITAYLHQECEKIILPAFALEMNLARVKQELRGRTPQARYKNFFTQNMPVDRFFFSRYPKLKTFLDLFADSTVDALIACLNRITADWDKIIEVFSLSKETYHLQEMKIPPNGDRHHQGSQTFLLRFNHHFALVYKPNPVNINQLLDFLTGKVNNLIRPPLLTKIPFLLRKNYRYRLFINKGETVKAKSEIKTFYLQAGKMLAFAYILSATDLHMDNLIVDQEKLYCLDNETYFHHFSFRGLPKRHNVFFTGLIANPQNRPKTGAVCGLQGGSKPRLSFLTPFVKNEGTDKIQVRYKKISKFIPHNRIYFKGKCVNPHEYDQEIIHGFKTIYNFFYQNKDLVLSWTKQFLNAKTSSPIITRQLIRSTSVYSLLIQSLFQPQNLTNTNFRKQIIKQLKRGLGNQDQKVKKLIPYEVKEIMSLNIPYFLTKITSPHLCDAEGNYYLNFFATSGIQNFERKVSFLSPQDLNLQTQKISSSLTQNSG